MPTLLRAVSAAVALLTSGSGTVNAPHEWLQFRLNQNNNAVLPGTLSVAWTVKTGAGFSSSPAIVDDAMYIGNNAGVLYAIDYHTGNVLWTFTAKAPLMSNPIVSGDMVIVGEGDQNTYSRGDDGPMSVGGGENALIAVGRADGKERWRVTLDGSAMPTPALINGTLVQHIGSGLLAAVDPREGTVMYSRDIRSIASMSAALPLDGTHFVSAGASRNIVWNFNVKDGTTAWLKRFPRTASGLGDCPPAGDGTRVYCDYLMPPDGYNATGAGQLATEHIYAIDAASGTLDWDVPAESGTVPAWNEAAIPLADSGRVFAGSSISPWMHAYDAVTGALLWRTPVHGAVKGGIAAKDGRLYFGDANGDLWALDEQSGRAIGVRHYDTSFNVGSPVIAGNTLIVGSNTGLIIATPLSAIAAPPR